MATLNQPAQTCASVSPASPSPNLAPETLLANHIAVDALLNGAETRSLADLRSLPLFRNMPKAYIKGALSVLESQGFLRCVKYRRKLLVVPDDEIVQRYLQGLVKRLTQPTALLPKGGLQ